MKPFPSSTHFKTSLTAYGNQIPKKEKVLAQLLILESRFEDNTTLLIDANPQDRD
jgi:hypothetical protein